MIQIAHRGSSMLYGDNNMRSFMKAIEEGFDMIELDVQLCKTGEVVIYHDIFIQDDLVCNYTLQELTHMDVVTLHEFLRTIRPDAIKLFFDLKGHENVVLALIDTLKMYIEFSDFRNVYISSFNRKFVPLLVPMELPLHIGYTTINIHTNEELDVLCKHCSFVCFDWTALDDDSIAYLRSKKKQVYSFTCSDDIERRQMMTYALDGIISNYLLWAQTLLRM